MPQHIMCDVLDANGVATTLPSSMSICCQPRVMDIFPAHQAMPFERLFQTNFGHLYPGTSVKKDKFPLTQGVLYEIKYRNQVWKTIEIPELAASNGNRWDIRVL